MAEQEIVRLRRLVAELRLEVERLEKTVREIREAPGLLEAPRPGEERLLLYGTAALLETFYTGLEKAFLRIASTMRDAPEGPAWHRSLLESMVLDVPGVRPAVLQEPTVRQLEAFLSFRHRFRNLYLFDLDAGHIDNLLARAPLVWQCAKRDLLDFCEKLIILADAV